MARFMYGPATGVTIELQRAPIVLRAVRDSTGKWDALDQVDDEAREGEEIFLYMIVPDTIVSIHVCRRGRGQRSGWLQDAEYVFFEPQPIGNELKSNLDWAKWCDQHRNEVYERYLKAKKEKDRKDLSPELN